MTITKEIPFGRSTIETVDTAVFDYLKNLNLHVTTNKGFAPVEVIWVSAERAFLAKKSKDTHGAGGILNLPLITVERLSIVKDPARKGTAWAHVPPTGDEKGGSITIARRINQDKTSNFANKDAFKRKRQYNFPRENKKVVYETVTIPMPVYITVMYKINLRTPFQQQMNEMTAPFLTKTGAISYFLAKHEKHRYECFIEQEFTQANNLDNLATDERKFETTFNIRCLGYLIGAGKNEEQPKTVVRENAVEITFPREFVMVGDEPDYTDKLNTYLGSEPLPAIKDEENE